MRFRQPDSKKFIELNKHALTSFKPERQFSLDPGQSFDFCDDLMKYEKAYEYHGLLKLVPTNQAADPDNQDEITYSSHVNLFGA